MSYILDALKRSEQERHQGELTPTTIDTIMYKPRPVKHQLWPYLLILVLLINLGVYLYFQFTKDVAVSAEHTRSERIGQRKVSEQHGQLRTETQNTVTLSQSATNQNDKASGSLVTNSEMTPGATVRALPEHVLQAPSLNKFYDVNQMQAKSADLPIVSQDQQDKLKKPAVARTQVELNEDGFEVIRPKQIPASKGNVSVSGDKTHTEARQQAMQNIPDNYERIEPTRDISVPQVSPVNADKKAEQGSEKQRLEQVPHLSDLPGVFQAGVPDIRFNSHIYSDRPAERRVMINDLYLREGQSFSGMRIETIGEFYIELEKQGQHFKLPVLRDWFAPR